MLIKAGRVDTIVVYKIDRLTRSLADFAKIVEILDATSASQMSLYGLNDTALPTESVRDVFVRASVLHSRPPPFDAANKACG